jgi:aminopeptidase-like protein
MHALVAELFPIPRSLTGHGYRRSLEILQRTVPLEVRKIPSGTPIFDWTVPREWNLRDAYIKDASGHRIVDLADSNLHVLGYSVPIKKLMRLDELQSHLLSDPEHPDWIPFRTSYYKATWGFCLSHRQRIALADGEYEVCIDASLEDGHLTYGELLIPGESTDEVLISAHACHPSLANDNLSGVVLAAFLARHVGSERRRYSYRFVFAPGTVGPIAWLATNEHVVPRIRHGLVLACVGDSGDMTYKQSRQGEATIDRAARHILDRSGQPSAVRPFTPYGYDERQYCSPGFNLPMGCLMRTPHGEYPEYHTSADDLTLVRPDSLQDSFEKAVAILDVVESNGTFVNLNPKCEPMLGKRGLYRPIGGQTDSPPNELAMLWVLNQSDGEHDLLDIAERAKIPFRQIKQAADALLAVGLLTTVADAPPDLVPNGNAIECAAVR